jgi:hypothetical protein
MKKILLSGLIAGVVLMALSLAGLYVTFWFFPGIAMQYFDPAFNMQESRIMIFYLHPFVIGIALSWFWNQYKDILKGSFITKGIEFGVIYALVASFPMIWLIYSAMNVSFVMVTTWFVLALAQGVVAGLVFEKTNPINK